TEFEGSCHNNNYLPYPPHRYGNSSKVYFPYSLIDLEGTIRMDIPNEKIPLGSEIKSINGRPIHEIQDRLSKFYHSDGTVTSYGKEMAVARGLFERYVTVYGGSTTYSVQFVDEKGKLQEINLPAI